MPHPKSYPLSGSTPRDLHLIPLTKRTHDAKWDAARFSEMWTCSTLKTTKFSCKYIAPFPTATKRKILRTDVPTVEHKYLFITYIIFVCLDPAVHSFWTDGPGINGSPIMFGGLHYLYSQTPTLHHPHLTALKVRQQKFLITQYFGLLRYTATNRGEQIITLYRGMTTLQNWKNRRFTMHVFFNFQFSSQRKTHNDFFPSPSRCVRWRNH
jgi:hypothetical protein